MKSGIDKISSQNSSESSSSHVRPTQELAEQIDKFVSQVAEANINDNKAIDLEKLIKIKNQLGFVVDKFESRPEFRIEDLMSARKRELDELIEKAESDYAERKLTHDTEREMIERELDQHSRRIQEVQKQTLINELKNMNEYLFYHTKIVQQMRDVNNALDDEGCCARSCFCFFGHSDEIKKKQQQLKMLQEEQDAFGSTDHTVVSRILVEKMQQKTQELLEKQAKLAANQPKETAQLLRDERAKLQADIDAKRTVYYHTISPAVMLNLVRFQSFLKRMHRKLNSAKSSAQSNHNTVIVSLIDGLASIVSSFLKKFNQMCVDFVCRPPANEENKISYGQYCERFHNLHEKEKLLLITGLPDKKDAKYDETQQKINQLNEDIFFEHLEPVPAHELELASVPEVEVASAPVMRM